MIVLNSRNVNDALARGVRLVKEQGVVQDSRNGPVWRIFEPVTTVYRKPYECVLFSPWRDANPFFHCVEALWLLAGRDDLQCLTPYVARMKDFSDDGGVTQPAAYGKRWRSWFNAADKSSVGTLDQLDWVVERLRKDPSDRRVVIQMWDPEYDVERCDNGGKDVPCNLSIVPQVINGALHITVTCRSNDMVLGAYGANAAHFAVLQAYLAGRLGLEIGHYNQISLNFHCYHDSKLSDEVWVDPYATGVVTPWPIFTEFQQSYNDAYRERLIQEDLLIFFEHGWRVAATKARWPFIRRVLAPMAAAHQHWKTTRGQDRYLGALEILDQVAASDWRLAGKQWIGRRHAKWQVAADSGVSHDQPD